MRNEMSDLIRETMKEMRSYELNVHHLQEMTKDLNFLKQDHKKVYERLLMKNRIEIEENEFKVQECCMIIDAFIKSKNFIDDNVEIFYL